MDTLDATNQETVVMDGLTGFNPFDTETAVATPAATEPAATPAAPAANAEPATPAATATTQEEILDDVAFLKNNFGWESLDAAKADIQRWKELEANPKTIEKEIQFANDESKRIFDYIKEGKRKEILEMLAVQDKLESADQMDAQNAIQFQLQLANKHYTKEDIQDIWEERYSKPGKPLQGEDEGDDEYGTRVAQWQEQINKIDRRIQRDGFAAKEALSKMKTEIVIPDIAANKVDPKIEETRQKELAELQKGREAYLQMLNREAPKFSGLKAKYEGKDAQYEVSFNATEEQKTALAKQLANFDVNEFFNNRWWDGNTPKVDQMMSDLFFLQNKEQVFQKLVHDSADQRLQLHIKDRKNIQIQDNPTTPSNTNNQAAYDKLGEVAFVM